MAGATPAAASAEEIVTGEKVKGPGTACEGNNVSNDHVKVCFQPDGEWIYVRDQDSDGHRQKNQPDHGLPPFRDVCAPGGYSQGASPMGQGA